MYNLSCSSGMKTFLIAKRKEEKEKDKRRMEGWEGSFVKTTITN